MPKRKPSSLAASNNFLEVGDNFLDFASEDCIKIWDELDRNTRLERSAVIGWKPKILLTCCEHGYTLCASGRYLTGASLLGWRIILPT